MTDATIPKYRLIYNDLRERIFSGELVSGSLLPSESKLCATHGVSRETARKALNQLESEGLIYVKPKVGYFVGTPNLSEFRLSGPIGLDPRRTQYLDVHGISAPEDIAGLLGIAPGHFVIKLTRLIYDEKYRPLFYEVKYLPYERAYPSVESEMRYAVFPDITLEKLRSFTVHTRIRIRASLAGETAARRLGCSPEDPVLLVERTFVQHNEKILGFSRCYGKQPDTEFTGFTGSLT